MKGSRCRWNPPLLKLLNFRRESGNCQICWSADAVGDVEVSGGTGAAQGVVLVSLPIFVLWSWCDLANAWLTVTRFTNVHFMSYLKCWNCCWTWNLCFLLIFSWKKKLQLKFAFWDTFKLLRCLNPRNWTIALGVIPRGHKYAQKPRNGSELTPVSEMGHSL